MVLRGCALCAQLTGQPRGVEALVVRQAGAAEGGQVDLVGIAEALGVRLLVKVAAGRGAAGLEYREQPALGMPLAQRHERLAHRRRVVREVVVHEDAARLADQILPPPHALEACQRGRQITEALELHLNMSREQSRKRAVELLELVGIPGAASRLDDYPHQFSGGMRQRVMIAMGLSCNPQLLIADEPTTALDVTIQAQIVDLVNRLKDELGMAIIWITHDLGVVAGMAQRVIVMYSGFIVEEAHVDEIYAQPRHPYTLGLLRSIPRLDLGRQKRLVPIEGLPPDLLEAPSHCPFAPRCAFAVDKCWEANPPLEPVGPNHKSACWVDISGVKVIAEVTETEVAA